MADISDTTCESFLRAHITRHGDISFGTYMDIALAHPTFGYYMTRDPFGADGDFTTAPEISQMFGEMIGAWIVDVWRQMGRPSRFSLIECGAGRGTFMHDILRIACKIEDFLDSVNIFLVDVSPILRSCQKKTLQAFDNITYVDDLRGIQSDGPCIILGNEFLDALPVEQLRRSAGGWEQKYVTHGRDGFDYKWSAASKELLNYLPQKTVSHDVYEVAPIRNDFIVTCSGILHNKGGAALFIDYGFSKRSFGDTVQAVQNHQYCDVLSDPGRVDITSHVDFPSLLECVRTCEGVIAESIITQRSFLLQLGIEYRAKALKQLYKNQCGRNIDTDLERLIGMDQMGDLFKVLCFHSGYSFNLAGFEL